MSIRVMILVYLPEGLARSWWRKKEG